MRAGVHTGWKSTSDLIKLKLKFQAVVSHPVWPGTELGSSAGPVNTWNCWAILSNPHLCSFINNTGFQLAFTNLCGLLHPYLSRESLSFLLLQSVLSKNLYTKSQEEPCAGSWWHCELLKSKQTKCLLGFWQISKPLHPSATKMKIIFLMAKRTVMSVCPPLFSWSFISCDPETEGVCYQGPFRSILEICNKYPLFFDSFSTDSWETFLWSSKNLSLFFKEKLFSWGICGLLALYMNKSLKIEGARTCMYQVSRT